MITWLIYHRAVALLLLIGVITGTVFAATPFQHETRPQLQPAHYVRALHLVLRGVQPAQVRSIIEQARLARMNMLILSLGNSVKLNSLIDVARQDALSIEEFVKLVAYARKNGLEVVPEVGLLTHQEKLFGNSPDLLYNHSTYDPRKPEVKRRIEAILTELIQLISPKAIHIGHDEVAGLNKRTGKQWISEGESPLPPELFFQDVVHINTFLNNKGVETWMWGDMLIAPHEFPEMLDKHLHGTAGYAALREKLPKNIVICDWHYFDKQEDFPSAKAFADLGHPVLGATWKSERTIRNFSRYMTTLTQNNRGMIATTWFHVQKGEWHIVDKIIRTSGEAFWNGH